MKINKKSKMEERMKIDRLCFYGNFAILVSQIHKTYIIASFLRQNKYRETIEDNLTFWGSVYYSFQDQLIINLHEIFNVDKNNVKVGLEKLLVNIEDISLKSRIEQISSRRKILKKNIAAWRNNMCGHKNYSYFKIPGKAERKYVVMFGEFGDLIDDLIELLQASQGYFTGSNARDYKKEFLEFIPFLEQDVSSVLCNKNTH